MVPATQQTTIPPPRAPVSTLRSPDVSERSEMSDRASTDGDDVDLLADQCES